MFLPGFLLIVVFYYGPMYGVQIAFKEYMIMDGIWGSKWVGLEHFRRFFFADIEVTQRVIFNTLFYSIGGLFIGFPVPILLALMINELKDGLFKRGVQNISYLPHFVSWVVVAALVRAMASPSSGPSWRNEKPRGKT